MGRGKIVETHLNNNIWFHAKKTIIFSIPNTANAYQYTHLSIKKKLCVITIILLLKRNVKITGRGEKHIHFSRSTVSLCFSSVVVKIIYKKNYIL